MLIELARGLLSTIQMQTETIAQWDMLYLLPRLELLFDAPCTVFCLLRCLILSKAQFWAHLSYGEGIKRAFLRLNAIAQSKNSPSTLAMPM